ncbi:MAG TPA: DUF3426 domain-containing protein [Gammaproteobacteria bacterium]|nr:DUF3426 domain-containing protein [Gammaproteobacteria bacterium]
MYTQCPNCDSFFRIGIPQLKSGQGKVRCGQCDVVFNALVNLTEELPAIPTMVERIDHLALPPPISEPEAAVKLSLQEVVDNAQIVPERPLPEHPPSRPAGADLPPQGMQPSMPEPSARAPDAMPSFTIVDEVKEDANSLSKRVVKPGLGKHAHPHPPKHAESRAPFVAPEHAGEHDTARHHKVNHHLGFNTEAFAAKQYSGADGSDTAQATHRPQQTTHTGTDHHSESANAPSVARGPRLDPIAESASPLDETKLAPAAHTGKQLTPHRASPTGRDLAALIIPDRRMSPRMQELETLPEDDLPEDYPPRPHAIYSWLGTVVWTLGIVGLLALLIVQYGYFMRENLAGYVALRPGLEKMCAVIDNFKPCEIPLRRELSQITLVNRDVRAHPTVQDALLANITLINQAPFPQAYPGLQLTLSDLNGTIVAKRRFQPGEYLEPGTDIKHGMTPQTPISVVLEIATPSIGFQLASWNFTLF